MPRINHFNIWLLEAIHSPATPLNPMNTIQIVAQSIDSKCSSWATLEYRQLNIRFQTFYVSCLFLVCLPDDIKTDWKHWYQIVNREVFSTDKTRKDQPSSASEANFLTFYNRCMSSWFSRFYLYMLSVLTFIPWCPSEWCTYPKGEYLSSDSGNDIGYCLQTKRRQTIQLNESKDMICICFLWTIH